MKRDSIKNSLVLYSEDGPRAKRSPYVRAQMASNFEQESPGDSRQLEESTGAAPGQEAKAELIVRPGEAVESRGSVRVTGYLQPRWSQGY